MALDFLAVPIIIILAYSFKFKVGWVFQKIFLMDVGMIYDHAQVEPYLALSGVIIPLWFTIFYFVGLYRVETSIFPEIDEFVKAVMGVSILVMALSCVTFFFKVVPDSKVFLIYFWLIAIIFTTLVRVLVMKVETHFLKKGKGAKRLLVLGADDLAQDIIEFTFLYPQYGLFYVGNLSENYAPENLHYHLRGRYQHLGGRDDLFKILKGHDIQAIFVSPEEKEAYDLVALSTFCIKNNIHLKVVSSELQEYSFRVQQEDINGVPLFAYQPTLSILERGWIKRAFDICFSVIFLILCLPLMIMISLCIWLVSPHGPILFFQTRVTQDGQYFKVIKFRTMVPKAEHASGPVMVDEKNESRYHPLGSFLRKSSLDELPQLWNIFRGEMSVVGPRPERPEFIKEFKKDIPNFGDRTLVKAGLTGWAQINGRSVLTRRPAHKLKYDLYYIKQWTFFLDIKIILKTLQLVLSRTEAF